MVLNTFPSFKIIKHVCVWVVLIIYMYTNKPFEGELQAKVVGGIMVILNNIFTYYFLALFILRRYKSEPLKVLVGVLISFAIFNVIQYTAYFAAVPMFGGKTEYEETPLWNFILNMSFTFFIEVLAAIAYYNNNLSIERIKRQAINEKLLILKDLVFLRNQFHSKFTFDFIDYCHFNVRKSSDEAAKAIQLFSKLLKYSLAIQQNEKVELSREVKFIEDFIALQKTLSTHIYIKLRCVGPIEGKHITSRILITFIENAIKHGVTNDISYPIIVNLKAEENTIYFSVENKKNNFNKSIKTGIGHQNVKQYLELFYSKKYKLDIQDSGDMYCSHLMLTDMKMQITLHS